MHTAGTEKNKYKHKDSKTEEEHSQNLLQSANQIVMVAGEQGLIPCRPTK